MKVPNKNCAEGVQKFKVLKNGFIRKQKNKIAKIRFFGELGMKRNIPAVRGP